MPAYAVSNSISITESAGVTTNNYPVQIGRPFVQGEIPNGQLPQAPVNGTAVPTHVVAAVLAVEIECEVALGRRFPETRDCFLSNPYAVGQSVTYREFRPWADCRQYRTDASADARSGFQLRCHNCVDP